MSQALEIVTLQSIDDDIAATEAAIRNAEARIEHDDAVEAARSAHVQAQDEHHAAVREQKRLEAEVARLNSRIVPEEKRLYSGEVKNPKELSSIQHEVELLKEQRGGFEAELLEVLERVELAEATLTRAKDALDAETSRWDADRESLTAEVARLRAHVAGRETARQSQAGRIAAPSLQVYDLVRKRKGMAVARLQGSSCGACRIALPEAVRKRAMSPVMLAQCPSCDRILYVG